MTKLSSIKWLGLQSYEEVEQFQKVQVPYFQKSRDVLVLGLEFHPVITLGVRGESTRDLLKTDIPVFQTDRGGQATLHSPGQLVIYPMLNLKIHGYGIKNFVLQLMEVTNNTLKSVGIESWTSVDDPGIYTRKGKIGFCGLKVDHGVVRHGLSINVNNNLDLFAGIRSCGRSQAQLDTVASYNPLSTADLFKIWVVEFQKQFQLSGTQSLDMNL